MPLGREQAEASCRINRRLEQKSQCFSAPMPWEQAATFAMYGVKRCIHAAAPSVFQVRLEAGFSNKMMPPCWAKMHPFGDA